MTTTRSSARFLPFWTGRTSSGQRYSGPIYNMAKAQEHANFMTSSDRVRGAVDLGCGAGEILSEFTNLVTINAAVDFSSSMIEAAKKSIPNRGIAFHCQDVFEYLSVSRESVWTSSQGINQYSDERMLTELFAAFAKSQEASAMYLFDTIDPFKYLLARGGVLGAYYGGIHFSIVKRTLMLLVGTVISLLYPRWFQIGYLGRIVGYGVSPTFWTRMCGNHDLNVRMVSSLHYEYRYHVAIEKKHLPNNDFSASGTDNHSGRPAFEP